jgi:phospholipid N-methyltransferase
LARRLAEWVPRGARVLEPSCGGGNILAALLRAGHAPTNLTGVDIDPDWARHCVSQWPALRIILGDFLDDLAMPFGSDEFDVIAGNFPFEDELHTRFTLRALELAPVVIGVFPVSFEFGRERDRLLWSRKGVVTRRARLPVRVDYGGTQSPSFDSVVLRIERRDVFRPDGEETCVVEEVWIP